MSSRARAMHPGWGAEGPHRAFLFAPGNHPVYVEKVARYGADTIVLDLEDAVPREEKAQARQLVAATIEGYDSRRGVAVRLNGFASGLLEADAAAVVGRGAEGILCPKVESTEELAELDQILAAGERASGAAVGSTWLVAIIETARGLVEVERLCAGAPERLAAICLGWADLSLDAGIELTPGAVELLYARSRVVFASRAAGLAAPIDGPWLWLDNIDGLVEDTALSRRLGFQGRIVVHPRHVDPVQQAYAELSPRAVERHEAIVRSFEAALAAGSASIQIDGTFVDYPVYERSRAEIRRHRLASQR